MTIATKLSRQAVRDIVLRVLSLHFGIPTETFTKAGRRSEAVAAKRAAIWFLVVKLRHPNRATATLLGYQDHTTVTQHALNLRKDYDANCEAYAGIEKQIIAKFTAAETQLLATDTFWSADKRAAMVCLWQRAPMTPEQIGRALGCTTATVDKAAADWGLMTDDFPVLNPYDDQDFQRLLSPRDSKYRGGLSFWTPPRAAALFAMLKYTSMTMQQIGSALGCDHTRLWQISERIEAFPQDARRPVPTDIANVAAQPSPAESRI